MGGSSICNSVKAANSKIAQMLRTREEDEALLQIGKRKIKDQAVREGAYGGRVQKAKRWSQKADFSYPSPLVDSATRQFPRRVRPKFAASPWPTSVVPTARLAPTMPTT